MVSVIVIVGGPWFFPYLHILATIYIVIVIVVVVVVVIVVVIVIIIVIIIIAVPCTSNPL